MNAFQNQIDKNIDPVAELLSFNAVEFITGAKAKSITPDEVKKVHKHCIQDGKCQLCFKRCNDTPDDTHKRSNAHLQKVHEQALCDRFFGESKLFSKKAMRDY